VNSISTENFSQQGLSYTADFAPGAQRIEYLVFIVEQNFIGINTAVSTVMPIFRRVGIHTARHRDHYMKIWRHPQNRKHITSRKATPLEEDRTTTAVHMHKNWRSSAVWFLRYASGQTDRHTRQSSQYFAPLPGAK